MEISGSAPRVLSRVLSEIGVLPSAPESALEGALSVENNRKSTLESTLGSTPGSTPISESTLESTRGAQLLRSPPLCGGKHGSIWQNCVFNPVLKGRGRQNGALANGHFAWVTPAIFVIFVDFRAWGAKSFVFVSRMHYWNFADFRQNRLFSAGDKTTVLQNDRFDNPEKVL